MDPKLANRLRRYGEQVDQASIVAQAGRPAPTKTTDADDTDDLAPVVPLVAARSTRRVQLVTAAAAATIVVVAGALVTWRITGESDPGRADSTQMTVNTTADPSTTSTSTTSVTVTTTRPLILDGGSSSTSSTASTSSSTTTSTVSPSHTTVPGASSTCPTGYHAYDAHYPMRVCDRGPAVTLIQQRVGAPNADGYFGPATRQSVRVFQEQIVGLEVDGLVGPATWAAMFPDGAPGVDSDGSGTVDPWEVG